MESVYYNIICVGAGGTGGNFIKEFARFLSCFQSNKVRYMLSIVDGDKVEKRNLERQPFINDDMNENKAVAITDAIQEVFGIQGVNIYSQYIDKVDDLIAIEKNARDGHQNVVTILLGFVDNHRARQVMHEFFIKQKNIIFIDSANEYEYGEVVVGAKMKGKLLAPDRTYYFPEVLKDHSPSASELSCGAINQKEPQHLCTNLMAAHLVLSLMANLMSNNKLHCGIIHFNAFTYYTRYEEYQSNRLVGIRG